MFSGSSLSSDFALPRARLIPALAVLAFLVSVLLPSTVYAGYLDLEWDAPTTNSDGTALTDLSHYRVYTGTSSASCPGAAYQQVPSPTPNPQAGDVITFTRTGLVAGTTYVAQVTAVDASGNESLCSNVASGSAKPDGSDTTPPSGTFTINGGAT